MTTYPQLKNEPELLKTKTRECEVRELKDKLRNTITELY